jgi:RND family efflux transporter MFP subunit
VKYLHVKVLILCLSLALGLHASSLKLSGVVSSENEKSISSRYMGFVKAVHVEEGSFVKKGEILYEIDSKEIDTTKTNVELSIAQSKLSEQMYTNQYANARLNLERHQRLLAKDMVSKFEVENLEVNAKNLKSMVEIAKAQTAQAVQKLQEVKNQYHYLVVRAPNDGVVISKHIKAGEMALPGVPALVLSDMSSLHVVVDVAETHLGKLKRGDKVHLVFASLGVDVEGSIATIVPHSNPQAHTFKVKIAFKSSQTLYPGMYAEVIFEGQNP